MGTRSAEEDLDLDSFSVEPSDALTPECTSMPQRSKCVTTFGVCSSRVAREGNGMPVSSAYSESEMLKSSPFAVGCRPVIVKSSRVRNMHRSYECSERQVSMTAAM